MVPPQVRVVHSVFSEVFHGVEGGSISQQERGSKKLNGSEFTYGEIELVHFLPLLKFASKKDGGVFWDLGCGTGKALVAAALSEVGFNKICGVEYLEGLHQTTLTSLQKYETVGAKAGIDPKRCDPGLFRVVKGDMREVDWSDADVIYASSICFPEELVRSLAENGKKLRKGTRIITLKNWADEGVYRVLHYLKVKMTWGKNGVYILERI